MWALNCQLFVGTESPPPDSLDDGSESHGHGMVRSTTVLPSRVKIANDLVLVELNRVLGVWLHKESCFAFSSHYSLRAGYLRFAAGGI